MPAPPSSAQKAANQASMNAAKSSNAGRGTTGMQQGSNNYNSPSNASSRTSSRNNSSQTNSSSRGTTGMQQGSNNFNSQRSSSGLLGSRSSSGNVNSQSAFTKMNSGTQSGMGFSATGLSRLGGISTPMASGSPRNNPTQINVTPGNGSLQNAMIQRQAVNAMAPSVVAPGERVTDVFTSSPVRMDPGIIAKMLGPAPTPAGQKVSSVFGPAYAQDPSIAGRLNAPQMANNVPIPRQNPLSDINKFNYQQGRPRDYVFGGMDQEAISRAVMAQQLFDAPVTATSGMRNPLLNKKVGGAKGSQHMQGRAIDLSINDTVGDDTSRLIGAMKQAGFTGIGGYRPGKVHGDIGPARSWGPDTRAASISQLPKNMQIAMASAPRPNVLAAITPTIKKGVTGLKNLFASNDVPIPQMKPNIPSTVAPATSIPTPQLKPRVPSDVAPARGAPVPQSKPQDLTITAAGDLSFGDKLKSTLRNGLVRTAFEGYNPDIETPAADTEPSFWEKGKSLVNAGYDAFTDANQKINAVPGGAKTVTALAKLLQGSGKPAKFATDTVSKGNGLSRMAKSNPKPVQGPTPPAPGFTWVQWFPGSPPTQIPTNALIGAA